MLGSVVPLRAILRDVATSLSTCPQRRACSLSFADHASCHHSSCRSHRQPNVSWPSVIRPTCIQYLSCCECRMSLTQTVEACVHPCPTHSPEREGVGIRSRGKKSLWRREEERKTGVCVTQVDWSREHLTMIGMFSTLSIASVVTIHRHMLMLRETRCIRLVPFVVRPLNPLKQAKRLV